MKNRANAAKREDRQIVAWMYALVPTTIRLSYDTHIANATGRY